MILAGIDEAGYGPLLGPLVVGGCAFELPGDPDSADLPCLWQLLKKVIAKTRLKSGRRLHVNDSKLVYNPSAGLRELERSVLAVLDSRGQAPDGLESLLEQVAPAVAGELGAYPWYQRFDGERFPIEQEAAPVRIFGNALRLEGERCAARCVYFAARVLLERALNRQLLATRNKSSVLFSASAMHLDFLLRQYADRGLVIFCDRQGGRERYGHLLRLMFDDWTLQIIGESEARAEYRLRRGPNAARIIFTERAEGQCMPVALASMLSKYLREALMRRFNAYWRGLLPELAPTAGYYQDGTRFLRDIDGTRRELGISDAELIRCR